MAKAKELSRMLSVQQFPAIIPESFHALSCTSGRIIDPHIIVHKVLETVGVVSFLILLYFRCEIAQLCSLTPFHTSKELL